MPLFSTAFAKHEARLLGLNATTAIFMVFGWVLLVVLTFYVGQFFTSNRADAQTFFNFIPWVLGLMVPALAMNTWAEETRRGTQERLLTLPLSLPSLVITRWAVLGGVLGLWLLGTWPFVATLAWLGEPAAGPLFTGYLGAFLLALMLLALNLWASLLASSAVVAFVGGFGLNLLVLFSGWNTLTDWLAGAVPDALITALKSTSLLGSYHPFTVGLWEGRSVGFFIGLSALFLGLGITSLIRKAERPSPWNPALIGLAVAVICMAFPRLVPVQLDTTPENLYTLSAASKKVIAKLPQKTTLTVYASRANPDIPSRVYGTLQRLEDILNDIRRTNPGKIEVKYVNPDHNVDLEVAATNAGIAEQPLNTGEGFYLGMVADMGGSKAIIPSFSPEREGFLEFDILNLLVEIQKTGRKNIAVLSATGLNSPDMKPKFLKELENLYSVDYLRPGEPRIPEGTSTLIVMLSPFFPVESLYAIDQYLAGGGHVLLLMDPFLRNAPSESLKAADHNADALAFDHPADLLRAWGVTYDGTSIVADNTLATSVQQQGIGQATYPFWLALNDGNINHKLPFTSFVNNMLLAESGYFQKGTLPQGLKYEDILATTPAARVVPRTLFDTVDSRLLGAKQEGPAGKKDLAILLTGTFNSTFESIPQGVKDYYSDYAVDPTNPQIPAQITSSTAPGALIAVADEDFLADSFALTPKRDEKGSISAWEPSNDNLVFLFNTIQYLANDGDLLELRGKALTTHPFTRVQGLITRMGERYQKLENRYAAELFTVTQRMAMLRANAASAQEANIAVEKEIQTYNRREFALRKQLREVRRGMRKELYRLELGIFLVNILTMPLLLAAGTILYRRHRAKKQKKDTK